MRVGMKRMCVSVCVMIGKDISTKILRLLPSQTRKCTKNWLWTKNPSETNSNFWRLLCKYNNLRHEIFQWIVHFLSNVMKWVMSFISVPYNKKDLGVFFFCYYSTEDWGNSSIYNKEPEGIFFVVSLKKSDILFKWLRLISHRYFHVYITKQELDKYFKLLKK